MTKLKNTKKGMAKKAMSISLVAAMLATSNVPVWAAEDLFSDGSTVQAEVVEEADVFTEAPTEDVAPVAEDVAPVVEEADASAELQAASDYKVETNMELKSGDWNTGLVLQKKASAPSTEAEKFVITDKNTLEVNPSKVEVYSGDALVKTENFDTDLKTTLSKIVVGLDAYKNSKQLTVKVYVANENEAVYQFGTELTAVDISSWTVTPTKNAEVYNGGIQSPVVTVNGAGGKTASSDDVVIKFNDAKEAKNVGKYDYYVEGVEANGYTGTATSPSQFEITPATPDSKNLSVVISGNASYNGNNTKPTVVVTDKYTNTVIPSELYTVTVTNKDAGTYDKSNVTITLLDKAKVGTDTKETLNNFKNVDVTNLATGEFQISALDLSKLNDKYTITVATKKVGENISWGDLTFTDKSTGKTVKYTDALPTPDTTLTILTSNNTAVGTGRIAIKPTDVTNKNIVGEYTATFAVVGNVITNSDVAFPAGTKINGTTYKAKTTLITADTDIKAELGKVVYTGSAVEPLKAAFSNLVLATSPTVTDQKLVLGTDYDLVYTDNTDSKEVSTKTSTVTLQFKNNYAGKISFDFEIAQAEAYVDGADVPFVEGKSSYDAAAKVVTKDSNNVETAVPTKEYTVTTTKKGTGVNTQAKGIVVFENKNYTINGVKAADNKTEDGRWFKEITSDIVAKDLKSCTATVEGTYVYTGEAINPKIVVKDGSLTLVEGKDYTVVSKTGTNAGAAHVTIKGAGNYTGTITIDYVIAKANMKDATVVSSKKEDKDKANYDQLYTGTAVEPDIDQVKVGKDILDKYDPITKKGDYKITWDENAVEVGTYNFTITAVASSTKIEGEFKGTFKVTPNELQGGFATKIGLDPVNTQNPLEVEATGAYYTGKAITLADFKTKYVIVKNGTSTVLTEGKDYRLEYKNNVDAGKATVTAYGLGNYAAVDAATGKDKPFASMEYYIKGKATIEADWVKKISNVEYAGGLSVEPEVIVMDTNNNRLVQGQDYTVEATATAIGNYVGTDVVITGKGAYATTDKNNTSLKPSASLAWKVTKKDMANTDITVADKNVTVMNGTVVVPSSEYDVKFSDDGKEVTVTAKTDSKYYTGTKKILTTGEAVGKATIKEVKVVGNKATVILSEEADQAVGYDYVISTSNDYKNGRVVINKNQLTASTSFQYLQKGTYYAYLHAWKRVDGKKVFGDWSNLYQFTVGTTTPDQPLITSVKVSGKTVKVTYTKSANATGYDVVLGSKTQKVNGELRPVSYGKLVKKVTKGTTVTATFTNVPKGTYYAGLHAYNRTSVNNTKVFSPWSNSKKVTVK